MPITSFRAISVRYYWSPVLSHFMWRRGPKSRSGRLEASAAAYRAPLATITYGTRTSPAKKDPSISEPTPKPATMSNKEFRRHLKQLVPRQRNEEPSLVEKTPSKSEPSKPRPSPKRSRPRRDLRKFNVGRKAKAAGRHTSCYRVRRRTGQISSESGTRRRLTNKGASTPAGQLAW